MSLYVVRDNAKPYRDRSQGGRKEVKDMRGLNRQGSVIMSAASLAGYRSIPQVAKAAGIPKSTLERWFTKDAGSMTLDRLEAVIRVTRMRPEQVLELVKGKT